MPIEVQHGGQAGPVAGQIIAQAGQNELNRQQEDKNLANQLANQRAMQLQEIQAHADLQRQAADDAFARTAQAHGLDQQIKQDEFDKTLKLKQKQAENDANQWEYKYTAQQRQEIAKYNTARQTINSSNLWSPAEKDAALQMIDLQQVGIKPAMMPRDPSKPVYEEGKGPGDLWVDATGATVTLDKDGRTPKLIQRYDQGPDAQAQKLKAAQDQKIRDAQAKHEEKIQDAQAKREEKLLDMRLKLATENVVSYDAKGNPTRQQRSSDEINKIMQSVLSGGQQERAAQPKKDFDSVYNSIPSGKRIKYQGPDGQWREKR